LDIYFASFAKKFQDFKVHHTESGKGDGKSHEYYEYPIGDKEKLQYFLAYGKGNLYLNNKKPEHTKSQEQYMMI
jgi:hypothetical protein